MERPSVRIAAILATAVLIGACAVTPIPTPAATTPAFVEDDYLFRLPDGRSMTLAVSASGNDVSDPAPDAEQLSAFARRVVETLRATVVQPGASAGG